MTKTAKRQIKKNNTKKMKGGIGGEDTLGEDTWGKKPILHKPIPNIQQRGRQLDALYDPNNPTYNKKEYNTDKKNNNYQEGNQDSDDESDNTQDSKSKDSILSNITGKITGFFSRNPFKGGRRRNTKKATRKAKKGGRIAKKGARKANKSRRTRK